MKINSSNSPADVIGQKAFGGNEADHVTLIPFRNTLIRHLEPLNTALLVYLRTGLNFQLKFHLNVPLPCSTDIQR